MLHIHVIFYEFDNGQYQIGIAKPTEDIIEDGEVFILHTTRDAMRERREDDAWQLRVALFDGTRHIKGIIVGIAWHAQCEVNIIVIKHMRCLLGGAHLDKRWWIAQTKFHVFIKYLLLYSTIILKHEGIIGIGYYKYIIYTSRHEIHE